MKRVVVLGSTGSIGRNALQVIECLGPEYQIIGLSASSRWELLAEQIAQFNPPMAALADVEKAQLLQNNLNSCDTRIVAGSDGVVELASMPEADIALIGITGAAALRPAVAAIKARKTLALANKECLVMAGDLITRLARESEVQILPVDSEHSAVFQALHAGRECEVSKIVLTASGGPFRNLPVERLAHVTPEEALRHPNWSMGQKITVDSATMMNKALEVIEAKWLFDIDVDQIEVVVHPESIVHSAIQFCDGAMIAQLGAPDMRVPIQYALTYPNRMRGPASDVALAKLGTLSFYEPDIDKFPALALGYRAAKVGGTMGSVLNAANEIAVESFLKGEIRFTDISKVVEAVMDVHSPDRHPDLEQVVAADQWAREEATQCLQS